MVNDTLDGFKNENLFKCIIHHFIHLTDLKTKIYSPKKVAEGLKTENLNTPKFHITPKIHH